MMMNLAGSGFFFFFESVFIMPLFFLLSVSLFLLLIISFLLLALGWISSFLVLQGVKFADWLETFLLFLI